MRQIEPAATPLFTVARQHAQSEPSSMLLDAAAGRTMPSAEEQHRLPSPPDRRPSRRGGHPSPSTASAAGRPAGLGRLAGTRRGLVGSARALAAAALLALVGALALPATAQADVLVSNLGQANGGYLTLNFDQAQAFTTGAAHRLTSVEIRFATRPSSAGGFTVSIWTDNGSGSPGAMVGSPLSHSGVFTDLSEFTTSGIDLEANTQYFVVVDATENDGLTQIRRTSSDDEDAADPGAVSDWSIGDSTLQRSWDSTGSWTPFVFSMKIRINGITPSTDATLSALTVTGGGSDLVTFVSGTTTYTAMVASTVTEVTVTATKNDTGATIDYLDGDDATLDDADTGVNGHQVTLAEGENVIKVKVTAADTITTETYTVTVTREADTTAPTPTRASVGRSGTSVSRAALDTEESCRWHERPRVVECEEATHLPDQRQPMRPRGLRLGQTTKARTMSLVITGSVGERVSRRKRSSTPSPSASAR